MGGCAIAATAGCSTSKLFSGGDADFDDNLMALFSDCHLPATNENDFRNYEWDELNTCIAGVLRLNPLPRNVLIFGDLAYTAGDYADYPKARELLRPLIDAGIKVTIAMGNHDRRQSFLEAFPEYSKSTKVPGRIVSIVESPKADFILLDTLQGEQVGVQGPVDGKLNPEQIEWLKTTLAGYGKPVFVGSHHPINEIRIAGLLAGTPKVAGYINGHDHVWRKDFFIHKWTERRVVRTLCLPSTGLWGDIGYTLLRIGDNEAVAELHQHDFFFPIRPRSATDINPEREVILRENAGATCTFQW